MKAFVNASALASVLSVVLFVVQLSQLGCNEGAHDVSRCMESVQKAFPKADVVAVPNERFIFIARDEDGSVWFVETKNPSNADVSAKVRIMKPLKQEAK